MMLYTVLKAAVCGVIEGLTEFIPVSSTGHLIIAQNLMGMTGQKDNAFAIFIQLGAIFAVLWLYREKLFNVAMTCLSDEDSKRLTFNLILGTIPAVVIGLPTEKWIEAHFFKPIPVSMAFVVGGFLIIMIEKWFTRPEIASVDDIPVKKAIGVGLFQVLAILFPGMSRSGSTIMGGMVLGLSRVAACEFSFFLAIPAMFGASIIKLAHARHSMSMADFPMFFTGFVVSFIVALFVIKALISFVSKKSFIPFAWYRIGFGLFLLLYWNFTGNF